jgi:hypothetical protein
MMPDEIYMEVEVDMAKDIEIQSDPSNPSTVILSRWPDESEKDQDFQEAVRVTRSTTGEITVNPSVDAALTIPTPGPATGQDGAQGSTAGPDGPDGASGSEDPDGSQGAAEGADDGGGDPEPDPEGLKCHLCDQPAYSRKGDLTKHIGANHG